MVRVSVPLLVVVLLSVVWTRLGVANTGTAECDAAPLEAKADALERANEELRAALEAEAAAKHDLRVSLDETEAGAEDLRRELQRKQEQFAMIAEQASSGGANEAALKQMEAKVTSLEKRLQDAETKRDAAEEKSRHTEIEMRKAREEAVKANSAADHSKGLQEENFRLKQELGEKAKLKDSEGRVKELEEELRSEKRRHDKETARLRDEINLLAKPLYLIALQRGQERLGYIYDWSIEFYGEIVMPKAKKAYAASNDFLVRVAPYTEKVEEALEPLRKRANEEWEKVKPQYEREVRPHLDKAYSDLKRWQKVARKKSEHWFAESRKHFFVFRERAIATLRAQPRFTMYAEDVIDGMLYTVAVIVFLLTIGPIFSLVYAIISSIIYYGLCCCVVRRCCCCCSGRKVAPKEAQSRKGQGSIQTNH